MKTTSFQYPDRRPAWLQKLVRLSSLVPGAVIFIVLLGLGANAFATGDCDRNGVVDVSEVQSAIDMYLGTKQPEPCVDDDASGSVSISEAQRTIDTLLGLAPALPAPTGTAAYAGDGKVTVSWGAVAVANSYNVYYGRSAGVTAATGSKLANAISPQAVADLTNGMPYFFVVTAVNSGGESALSNEASAIPMPPVPAQPTGIAVSGGNGSATVSWNAVSGATSYNVYYGTSAGVTPANGNKLAAAASPQAITGLTNGTSYYFVVTAVNASGEGAVSDEKSAVPVPPAPGKPTGIAAAAGDSSVTVSWTAVSGATSYNIYYGTSAGVTTSNGSKLTGATSPQAVTGLTNGTTYYFVVSAVNAGGEGVLSSEKSAVPVPPAPGKPTGIAATAADSAVTISWTAVSGATSYNIYYGTSAGVTVANGSKLSGATSPQSVTGLTNGATYYFVVSAVNAGGESVLSSEKSAVPVPPAPGKPTGIAAAAGDSSVTVSWTAVSGATSYNIYYGTSAGVTTSNGSKLTGATSPQAVTGLTNGTTYYFVVSAVNAGGEGVLSSEKSATPAAAATPPASPTGVAASGGDGAATVSWSAVAGATSYNLYYGTSAGVTAANGIKVANAVSPQTVSNLNNGTAYYFVVSAVNANGESALSSEKSATPAAVVLPPTNPSGIVASGGDSQVTVSWTAVSGASSYNIYYRTSSGVTAANGTKFANAVSPQAVTGLTNSTTYFFVVTAVNAGGESGVSSEKSATPSATVQAPGSPNGRAVSATVPGQMTVSWNAVSGATSYNVYFLQSATVPTKTQVLAGPKQSSATASLTVTGLTSGATYYVLITAVNAGGESGTQTNALAVPIL